MSWFISLYVLQIWFCDCILIAGGKNVATYICRLRPSGNHTATFAANHNFFEQILDWSIGESM